MSKFLYKTALYDWFRDVQYDVIFLKETHFIKNHEVIYNSTTFQNQYIAAAY